MKSVMIAAMHSGAGKTVMSCALMAALKKRGLRVQAFKSGPDYIDPMFHSHVLGVESRNLDLFLQGEAGVKRSFSRASGDLALVEGAMGYYDGINGGTDASAWALADLLELPTILVLRPKGSGVSLAAQVCGMRDFRRESLIAGLLLADCTDPLAAMLRPILERECDLPVLGHLPPMEEARIESRHLGLLTAAEVEDLTARFDRIAETLEQSIDLDALLDLLPDREVKPYREERKAERCRIAVARDEAFCFQYADNLDALQDAGAELCFFSPLRDHALPEGVSGLYLSGGYPELHAESLARNRSMRDAIRGALSAGMPTVAECGGFLYLQQTLEDPQGVAFPMCGSLPGQGFRTGKLQRFGYQTLTAETDSLLFQKGEIAPAHEFHYWDSTENGTALCSEKADGRSCRCGYADAQLYAAFPHLHFGGALPMARRFVKACEVYERTE